ncbi:MAG: lipoyl synthase [Planctomycetes bacterium]|nr:lipoyl synthase [Planctomycetota bacterium]
MGGRHVVTGGELRVDYARAWAFQRRFHASRRSGTIGDLLWILEHPPVVTLGTSGDPENLLADREDLARRGVAVERVDRGGDITVHVPGQLVGYPIIDLAPDRKDVHRYLRDLEEVLIRTLAAHGIRAARRAGRTGVWVGEEKIAAIGIRVSSWVTMHGFALNRDPDIEAFRWIVPCGIRDAGVTSMAALLGAGRTPSVEDLAARIRTGFEEIVGRKVDLLLGDPERPAFGRKPPWLRVSLHTSGDFGKVRGLLRDLRLHTVCREAHCPNIFECFSAGTATFLILGDTCTRHCAFCAVSTGKPEPLDPEEPDRLAEAVARLGLRYAVITSVDRDDVPDGGADAFARTIEAIRRRSPEARIEVLIPDFKGEEAPLARVLEARPDVLGYNLETVRRLYPEIRPASSYDLGLELLARAAARKAGLEYRVKSGIMVGLGETEEEVRETMRDLAAAGADLLSIGQYLAPSGSHRPVDRFAAPDEFERYRTLGDELGFLAVEAGPLVRSSYRAREQFERGARSDP